MKALVTGGGGFLGGAIVRMLLERGHTVRTFQRGDYPALSELGAECVRGDLADAEAVAGATAGCDTVFHTAARVGVWGPRRTYEQTNVLGTQNVIGACRNSGAQVLIFTSTPSVVFDGRDEEGITEQAPYPEHYLAHYPRTKAQAEREVLAANGPDLATAALRPHLIWGLGDPHLVSRIVKRARMGRLRLVGDGANRVDSTYIQNAAEAHLLAAERLLAERAGAACAGKAYFISNGEPLAIRDLINRILAAAGLEPVTRQISPGLAYGLGTLLEWLYGALRIGREPPMTRFVARQLATAHWFDISAARKDLGYQPRVSIQEGMAALAEQLGRE